MSPMEMFGLDELQQQKMQGQRDGPAASGVFRAGHALQWDSARCLLMNPTGLRSSGSGDCHSNVK